jgi:DNA-directed RNA polymerase specialized sigma24 family protein
MSLRAELSSAPLGSVAERCARETERFYRRQVYDPWFCFELYRRAIVGRCQQAWAYVYAQYQPQVESWIRRHSAFPSSGEELPYLVNCTFEKMWSALTPDKFAGFPSLSSLLRYLQMCVHSVLLDLVRAAERAGIITELERADRIGETDSPALESQVLDRVERQAFWKAVSARLKNKKERRVVYGLYVLGLKPRELCARHPDLFRSASEVYRVRENVIARLRRDDELARLFGRDA